MNLKITKTKNDYKHKVEMAFKICIYHKKIKDLPQILFSQGCLTHITAPSLESFSFSFVLLWLFKTGFLGVALAVLELTQ